MIRENQFPRNFSKINEMSFELGLLETIGYFVICLSKKVLILAEIVLKTTK